MQLNLTPGKIIMFAVIFGVIEIIKFIILMWFGSSLSKISRFTKHTALKMNQLCKLTSDQQIVLRTQLNELKSSNNQNGNIQSSPEQDNKKNECIDEDKENVTVVTNNNK